MIFFLLWTTKEDILKIVENHKHKLLYVNHKHNYYKILFMFINYAYFASLHFSKCMNKWGFPSCFYYSYLCNIRISNSELQYVAIEDLYLYFTFHLVPHHTYLTFNLQVREIIYLYIKRALFCPHLKKKKKNLYEHYSYVKPKKIQH